MFLKIPLIINHLLWLVGQLFGDLVAYLNDKPLNEEVEQVVNTIFK
jgi:hypothetical protein